MVKQKDNRIHNKDSSIRAEWDEDGVYFYQAYNDEIADWAIEHQQLGGPHFKPTRMTWIKPSFAWVLYRSGYATLPNQTRILKIKLSHEAVASLLGQCRCGRGGRGSLGRVQWDPERDMMEGDGQDKPRKMLSKRSIQIGFKGRLSEEYVESIVSIQDVTELAQKIGIAHELNSEAETTCEMNDLTELLPKERPYSPKCSDDTLRALGLMMVRGGAGAGSS